MDQTSQSEEWTTGFNSALDEAIRLVDAMRGPTTSGLASPILLRIRAELIALREPTQVRPRQGRLTPNTLLTYPPATPPQTTSPPSPVAGEGAGDEGKRPPTRHLRWLELQQRDLRRHILEHRSNLHPDPHILWRTVEDVRCHNCPFLEFDHREHVWPVFGPLWRRRSPGNRKRVDLALPRALDPR